MAIGQATIAYTDSEQLVFGPKFRGWWKYASHPELLTFTGLVGAEMAGEGKYEVDTRAKQD